MTTTISNAFDKAINANATEATPNSPVALLLMDTVWRLSNTLLKRENSIRAKTGKAALVPGHVTMREGIKLVSSFESFFVKAELNDKGEIQWVPGDKANLPPIYFDQMEALTSRLLQNFDEIKNVKLDQTATAILREREGGDPAIPDLSGSKAANVDFTNEIANKVIFYATRMASIVRNSGYRHLFNPRSTFTLKDITDALELQLGDYHELGEVDDSIDRPGSTTWSLADEIQKPLDIVELDNVELQKAQALQAALKGWYDVYQHFVNNNTALHEEITYMRDLTAQRVAEMRNNPVVHGVEKR